MNSILTVVNTVILVLVGLGNMKTRRAVAKECTKIKLHIIAAALRQDAKGTTHD